MEYLICMKIEALNWLIRMQECESTDWRMNYSSKKKMKDYCCEN